MTTTATSKREQVLAAAEVVFARKGFDGATMREVAEAAGVGLSLVVYHFTTKEGLYQSIFEARQYVNDDRLARLREVTDPQAPDALDRLVSAFVDPVLDLHDDPADVWFARLVLREASDPSSQDRAIISGLFDPMAREFVAALERILPDRPPGYHAWAYLFAVGALTQSSFDARIDNIAGPDAAGGKREHLRRFLTAALRHS
ncbi:TetR family transcriptional regulator [Pseudonocardia kujensis]|uniref:TetR/AcrR family transcriptional regulator n=1 Tax=Pseudonocardia kujensis TaxID=1128675 RepID=UPI001E3CCA9A|nr:TetR/AcrR family transcriptional regulator [Pseudonocardia kujensis]MCE0762362.1 TetR family transcriptional regulator [Pseudonocardia kujensis]